MTAETSATPVLSIRGLHLEAAHTGQILVAGASLTVVPGEVHALVGESGSGKTLISRAAIGLLPTGVRRTGGHISVGGSDVTDLGEAGWRTLRGARLGMVFQEPMVSLNPAQRIGTQMIEAYRLHRKADRDEARRRAVEMLELFQVTEPEARMRQYPHEFSGGMRQRILLAAVMMLEPELLLADEPTTALDAVIQKEVLDTMVSLAEDGMTMLCVTHEMGFARQVADRVIFMDAGQIVEMNEPKTFFANPQHERTKLFLSQILH